MRKLAFLGLIIFVAAFLFGGAYYWYSNLKVKISVEPNKQLFGLNNKITIKVEPSSTPPKSYLTIKFLQNGKEVTLYSGDLQKVVRTVSLNPKNYGFKSGEATIVATLETPFYKKEIFKKVISLDLTPPSAEIVYKPSSIKVGYPSFVVVKPSEPVNNAYVKFGNATFPLLSYKNGTLLTFITAPLFALKKPGNFELVLQDKANNTSVIPLDITVKPIKLKVKNFKFSKKTLDRLILKFFPSVTNPVEQFKTINEVFRKEDENKFIKICSTSENRLYIKGTFAVSRYYRITGIYGELRKYYYNGKLIGTSIHKGMDLSMAKGAPVIAANDGKVIFTGRTKVYGNVIIIDHGYGLFTLYAHLENFKVKPGDTVKKGQVIGQADTTGFALGSHLHFGVLVWGYATRPYFYFISWNMNHYIYNPLNRIFSSPKKKTDKKQTAKKISQK